ncbi:AraC family transcriptional regulator [Agrobacterium tumefaciens]|jgi:AraC-like DNA-binding protein|uniref:Transcriptional regulator, AraC family n=1 Tax=Agrobacterium fabrum (strain C58 / ATCC 33970) TaxID=176299 RepID=Q7CW43_AGRFC|nr:AraC family transcriptional regulator [Agrobacterium fabrum]KEY50016.1 AraC family transcriptional regulator [Agrobacterium tumefaciens]AAK88566.2 transcriptional regulator, AraC family [Agrobacterium fabrum str. C58]KJX85422.1 HTH-type transcriptional activator rhaS [Agrobacterium tumefaciens]MCX2878509.1 AraC family transcriptional regulator [Agrobacterium fabrum]NMV73029.1 AraC family transcriptional regulator [Agrobacterium fabrum]
MKSEHTIEATIARHAPHDGTFETQLPGLKLIRCSETTLPMPVVYEPTLCLVAQGRKQAVLGQTSFVYDPSSYLVASVDLPVMGSVIEASKDKPYLSMQLDLDTVELADLAIRYPSEQHAPINGPIGLLLNKVDEGIIDAASRLLALLDTPRDIDALSPLAKREILYRLITGVGGAALRQIVQAGAHVNQIARSIVWIRKHFRETCSVEAGAEVAGMSRSTFHAHFKAVTNMSPLEFRTQLRLQEARRLMLSEGLDAATAGFQVGYASPSQFSREYGRVFGMSPAKHANALRQSPKQWIEPLAPVS